MSKKTTHYRLIWEDSEGNGEGISWYLDLVSACRQAMQLPPKSNWVIYKHKISTVAFETLEESSK